jgi:hypothetical protein
MASTVTIASWTRTRHPAQGCEGKNLALFRICGSVDVTAPSCTIPFTPIPGWAIAHLGSATFPNPSRVRLNGANSSFSVSAYQSVDDR